MYKKDLYISPVHQDAYRRNDGELPKITGVYNIKPSENSEYRICFEVTYLDGQKDFIPFSEIDNRNYYIVEYFSLRLRTQPKQTEADKTEWFPSHPLSVGKMECGGRKEPPITDRPNFPPPPPPPPVRIVREGQTPKRR